LILFPSDSFAYGLLTHIELATQAVKVLTTESKIIDVYLMYLMFGAIGPDLFNRTGFSQKLHHKILTKFTAALLGYVKQIKEGEKKDKLRAYVYGYLTHIAGDIHGHPLAHRLSRQREHNTALFKVYVHQDIYIAMKYHTRGNNKNPNINIPIYSLDGDIARMLIEVYNSVISDGNYLDWDTLMSCFDRTKFSLWLLTIQVNNSFIRKILSPFSPKQIYTMELDYNFNMAKKEAEEFIISGHTFLYQTPWEEHKGYEELIGFLENNIRIDCPLCN
jgi:hypothetical protein